MTESKSEKVVIKPKVEKKPTKKMYRVINYTKDVIGIHDNSGKVYTLRTRTSVVIDRIPEPRNGLVVEEIVGNDRYKEIDIEKEYQIAEKKRFKEKRLKELNEKIKRLEEQIRKLEKEE